MLTESEIAESLKKKDHLDLRLDRIFQAELSIAKRLQTAKDRINNSFAVPLLIIAGYALITFAEEAMWMVLVALGAFYWFVNREMFVLENHKFYDKRFVDGIREDRSELVELEVDEKYEELAALISRLEKKYFEDDWDLE